MGSLDPQLPSSPIDWTQGDVRTWLEGILAARFPGRCFGTMLTALDTLHLVDGPILLTLRDAEWQEAVPSIGARKFLMQEVYKLNATPPPLSALSEATVVSPRRSSTPHEGLVQDLRRMSSTTTEATCDYHPETVAATATEVCIGRLGALAPVLLTFNHALCACLHRGIWCVAECACFCCIGCDGCMPTTCVARKTHRTTTKCLSGGA